MVAICVSTVRRLVNPAPSGPSLCADACGACDNHVTSMQRRTGRAQRGSIYSNPGVSTHRQQDQQAQQRDVGQPLHDTQNPRKRPHSQLSASTNLLDDEFDDIGSAALSNYEMSQHQGAEPHTHTPFQQSSANPPPPAALHYNPYTSTASSSVSGHTSTSSGSEQLPASVCDPTYLTPSVGLSITQAQSAHQQQIAQLENERYRYLGEAKTWRDRFSHEEKIRRDKEQELHSLQESRKLELAAMEKEYTRKLEQLSTQLEFAQKELTDEREKRKASDEKLKHLGGSPSFEQVIRVPPQVVRAKRPKQQYSPASGLLPAFPSTASFMESPSFLVASTPLQFKRPQEMHPAPFDADGRSSMQPSTEARDVTPKPSPLLGALMTHKSVQTPSQSSSMLCVSSSAAVLGRSSFIVPQSEGDVFMVDTVQSNGRFSGAELLQRLVQWNAQETKAGVDSAVSHQDKVIFQPEEDALSPSTDEEEEETEDAERSDSHDAPPMQPDGFFSLMTCLNPFFIAGTSKPIDALLSPRHSTASTSKKGRRALKDNTSLVKAAILQSIGRKRRLVATEDSESSSSDDSSSMKANPSGNMSPFLLDSASQSQLQECVSRLLASAGVPHTTTASVEPCTPLHFGGQHSVHSPVQQHGGEDQGLSLLYFLQSRIIAYCRECTSESSQQGDIGDSLSPTTTDSLAGSDKGTNTSSVSFDGSSVDFYGPLLQLLKTLLLLVQYSPSVREKICESPPCLVYDSILASRPGSRSSGHADSHSESSSCGSKGSSVELMSQKSSLDLSDQLSGRMDSSNEQRQPTSKLGLVASDLRSTSLGGILAPCPSLSKVYTAVSSISATASSSNQPSFSLSERDLAVDVMCHSSLTAQFFPLLLRLAETPWVRGLKGGCGCVGVRMRGFGQRR